MDRSFRIIVLLAVLPLTMQEGIDKGACQCAVFATEPSESIIEHTFQYNVTCNQEGAEKCQNLCIALAEGTKEKGQEMICEVLNRHVENLEVGIYSKECNGTTWKFTGLKSSAPICCHEGKAAICPETTTLSMD